MESCTCRHHWCGGPGGRSAQQRLGGGGPTLYCHVTAGGALGLCADEAHFLPRRFVSFMFFNVLFSPFLFQNLSRSNGERLELRGEQRVFSRVSSASCFKA